MRVPNIRRSPVLNTTPMGTAWTDKRLSALGFPMSHRRVFTRRDDSSVWEAKTTKAVFHNCFAFANALAEATGGKIASARETSDGFIARIDVPVVV